MKIVFVTGGVLSGLWKGVSAASIGALFEAAGKKVFLQKLDGYLNVDPGTMSPTQHGEVFVTDDGLEADLDLGHYERFTNRSMSRESSYTSGRFFAKILQAERDGAFLWKTVQIIPHMTDLVKKTILDAGSTANADVMIVEIGGTIGDMENEYFLEAARQLRHDLGRESVAFVHLTLLPFLQVSKEYKSKPTQHSVRTLMSYGITPDVLLVRTEWPELDPSALDKIAHMCSLDRHQVVWAPNSDSIYNVPLWYHSQGLDTLLLTRFGWGEAVTDASAWQSLQKARSQATQTIRIALVGKYVWLEDAYFSLNEALRESGTGCGVRVQLDFVDSQDAETVSQQQWADKLSQYDAVCVPWGFGDRGIEGMIRTVKIAREQGIPYFGICLWSQIAVIEFARNVLGLAHATSQEFDPATTEPVVHLMATQKWVQWKGANMRLGAYPCVLSDGSLAARLYGTTHIVERHRHRYEMNPSYHAAFEQAGMTLSGKSPDGQLMEIVEIPSHPFFVACQFHPEFLFRPITGHPLFRGFIEAAVAAQNARV